MVFADRARYDAPLAVLDVVRGDAGHEPLSLAVKRGVESFVASDLQTGEGQVRGELVPFAANSLAIFIELRNSLLRAR